MQLSFGECDGLNQDELCENVLNAAHASTNTDDFRICLALVCVLLRAQLRGMLTVIYCS